MNTEILEPYRQFLREKGWREVIVCDEIAAPQSRHAWIGSGESEGERIDIDLRQGTFCAKEQYQAKILDLYETLIT